MKESKALNIVLLVLKILLAAVLVGSLILFTWMLIDAYVESGHMPPPENGTVQLDPFPIVFVLVLILSLVTNGACMVIALVGLILSICYKASPQRRKNIFSFTVFLILPVLLEIFYLLFYFLAA